MKMIESKNPPISWIMMRQEFRYQFYIQNLFNDKVCIEITLGTRIMYELVPFNAVLENKGHSTRF